MSLDRSAYTKVLEEYRNTCSYLKQINSNKANKYSKYNNRLTYITIIFTVVLSALAFIDKKIFLQLFNSWNKCDSNTAQLEMIGLCFNGLALLVLILTLINLLYRFQERSSTYFHTVTTLSSIIRDINILLKIEHIEDEKFLDEFELIKTKFNIILDYLPQHTDKEFIKAKYDSKVKSELSSLIKTNEIPKWKLKISRFCLKIYLENKKGNRNDT